MTQKILFHIADLQRITGYSYDYASRVHRGIRDALGCKSHLTIRQYCKFEGLPYREIYNFLTGATAHPGLDLEESQR